jgi:hypothetical protein
MTTTNAPNNGFPIAINMEVLCPKAPMVERPRMSMDVMIDIETMATTPDAVILQIGAVAKFRSLADAAMFEGAEAYSPLFEVTLDSDQANRVTSTSTMAWWKTQNPEAFNNVAFGAIPLREALHDLNIWIAQLPVPANCLRMVSKGSMDFVILDHAYMQLGIEKLWKYWQVADLRTLLQTFPHIKPVSPVTAHTALYDALAQMDTLSIINMEVDDFHAWKDAELQAKLNAQVAKERGNEQG